MFTCNNDYWPVGLLKFLLLLPAWKGGIFESGKPWQASTNRIYVAISKINNHNDNSHRFTENYK